MRSVRAFAFSFQSTLVKSFLLFAMMILVGHVLVLTAQEAAQPYQAGAGHVDIKGTNVPFVPTPKGTDGKVHQVVPLVTAKPRSIGMTPEGLTARTQADQGVVVPSTKPFTRILTPAELKALAADVLQAKSFDNGLLKSNSTEKPIGSSGHTNAPSKTSSFTGSGDTGSFPPDGGVAAGPYNVAETVNSILNVYDKNGNLLSSQQLSTLFAGLTGANDGPFDPSVAYDPYIGRFWVFTTSAHDSSQSDPNNRSTILVAVSNTSDITNGGWSTFWMPYDIDGNGSNGDHNGCDYPHFGFDSQAIYFSCNMFSFPFFSSSSSFQYAKVRIMTKSQFLGGGCCSWYEYWDLREGFLNLSKSFTIRPAIMYGASDGDGDYWVNAEGGGGGGSSLKVRRLTNAQNCCNGSNPSLDDNDQGVGSFDTPPGARQPGTSTTIDSGDTRLLFANWQGGHLSTGQNTACSQGGTNQACVAFTEIDVSSYPSMSNVNDWVLGSSSGRDNYYGAVDQNSNSDKAMVYTGSDPTSTFASAFYVTIPNSSVCTLCTSGENTLLAGAGTYVVIDSSGRNRWGDYQGAGADPDGLGIWLEGEAATSSNAWVKEIGSAYNSYAPSPAFTVNPVAFGNQTVFTTSGTIFEFFVNNGNATVYTSIVYLSGDPDFSIVADGCSNQVIEPGGSCFDILQFSPTSVGAGSATLNVDNYTFFNSFAFPLSVNVTGTGTQASTSTTVGSQINPSVFGQSIVLTAAVSSSTSGTPTGTVTFDQCVRVGRFCLFFSLGTAPVNNGVATLTISSLGVGQHLISASYGGDSNFTASSSSFITQTVNQDASNTAVVSSKNPAAAGTAVTFTVSVSAASPGKGTPTGNVTILDGATVLTTVALASGKASFTTSSLALGAHTIHANYGGDANFTASNASLLQFIDGTTTTALVSSINPSVFGQTVKFTATINHVVAGTPTGTVTFKDGGTTLGIAALSGGVASFSTATLPATTNTITAVYSGDSHFLPSTSPSLSQKVNKASTKAVVASSVNPSVFGEAVTFTATVTSVAPGTGVPTGTATFRNGSVVLGTVALVAGKAKLTTAALLVGAHSITATYNGSSSYNVSLPGSLTQTVNKASTKAVVASSANPSLNGEAVTFTATVTSVAPGTGVPTGTVTFKNGSVVLGTIALVSGKAKLTTAALLVGAHSITAAYNGSASYNVSLSGTLTQTVNKASTKAVVASSVNPSVYGEAVTFTATVTSVAPGTGVPTGTVTFKNGSVVLGTISLVAGKATLTTAALLAGAHSITATYNGSSSDNVSLSGTLTQTVNKAATTSVVTSSPNPSILKQSVTITVTVAVKAPATGTPSGSVTLKDGTTTLVTGSLSSGKLTFSTSSLAHGSHSLTAVYAGSANDAGSASAVHVQTVN